MAKVITSMLFLQYIIKLYTVDKLTGCGDSHVMVAFELTPKYDDPSQ